jgi:hypothetical protein
MVRGVERLPESTALDIRDLGEPAVLSAETKACERPDKSAVLVVIPPGYEEQGKA